MGSYSPARRRLIVHYEGGPAQRYAPTRVATRHVLYCAMPLPALPELVFIGRGTQSRAVRGGVSAHRHDVLEISYTARGLIEWWVGREVHPTPGGHVLLVWPGERHGAINDIVQPSVLYWLGVPLWPGGAVAGRTFCGLPRAEARALVERLVRLPSRRFAVGPDVLPLFERLLGLTAGSRDALGATRARLTLLAMLLQVADAAARSEGSATATRMQEVKLLIDAHLEAPLPLSALAARLGWSLPHFKAVFRRDTGMPPAQYYVRRRLGEAARRLRESSATVTTIGHGLGWTSSQSFANAFMRVYGLTPRAFRSASRTGGGLDPRTE